MKLLLIIDSDPTDRLAGCVDTPEFLLCSVLGTEAEIIDDIREQIAGFIKHEGAALPEWKDVDASEIEFDIVYE